MSRRARVLELPAASRNADRPATSLPKQPETSRCLILVLRETKSQSGCRQDLSMAMPEMLRVSKLLLSTMVIRNFLSSAPNLLPPICRARMPLGVSMNLLRALPAEEPRELRSMLSCLIRGFWDIHTSSSLTEESLSMHLARDIARKVLENLRVVIMCLSPDSRMAFWSSTSSETMGLFLIMRWITLVTLSVACTFLKMNLRVAGLCLSDLRISGTPLSWMMLWETSRTCSVRLDWKQWSSSSHDLEVSWHRCIVSLRIGNEWHDSSSLTGSRHLVPSGRPDRSTSSNWMFSSKNSCDSGVMSEVALSDSASVFR